MLDGCYLRFTAPKRLHQSMHTTDCGILLRTDGTRHEVLPQRLIVMPEIFGNIRRIAGDIDRISH
jgi:hypothetical protein